MAECSSSAYGRGEIHSTSLTPIDSKTAKKAIAKAARPLRTLLTDRKDQLVEQGLLAEGTDTKDVVKELKERIGNRPSLFDVLLREIRKFPGGGEVAEKLLQGK